MSKMIQIRNVPDDLHRKLKVRAAGEGVSLSDYLLGEIRGLANQPTLRDLRARLAERESIDLDPGAADLIRGDRGAL